MLHPLLLLLLLVLRPSTTMRSRSLPWHAAWHEYHTVQLSEDGGTGRPHPPPWLWRANEVPFLRIAFRDLAERKLRCQVVVAAEELKLKLPLPGRTTIAVDQVAHGMTRTCLVAGRARAHIPVPTRHKTKRGPRSWLLTY